MKSSKKSFVVLLMLQTLIFIGCGTDGYTDTKELPEVETLAQVETLDVNDTVSIGTTVGKVTIPIKSQDSVKKVELTGDGSENFTISKTGEISIKSALKDIDKISKLSIQKVVVRNRTYSFKVKVTYASGKIIYMNVQVIVYTYIQTNDTNNTNNTISTGTIEGNTTAPINNPDSIKNVPPTIIGFPKTLSYQYDIYHFLPKANDVDGDILTFSIENKPLWAKFNASTGLLSGIPDTNGSYNNIIISVSDSESNVSLTPFSIKVKSAKDLAFLYGRANQTPSDNSFFKPALKAIDANDNTNTATFMDSSKVVWWQLKLPSPTKIHKIRIKPINAWWRDLLGTKVYILNSKYTGSVNESSLITTLKGNVREQILDLDGRKGNYLLIRRDTKRVGTSYQDHILNLASVEVYGTTPSSPIFTKASYQTTIHRWYNKVESVLDIDVLDYQDDLLHYQILDNVPFSIDENGTIRVTNVLTENSYSFNVEVNDGINSITTPVIININDTAKANQHIYTTDATPLLTGYLPNTYSEGDSVSIEINGISYLPNINSDGTWRIEDDTITPRLDIGNYDISIAINLDTPIVYVNFFQIYGVNEISQEITLTPSYTIETVNVTVSASSSAPLPRGKKVRGSSMWLKQINNQTVFINESFRKMKSLIATYKDDNNVTVFKKLVFDTPIEPYSENNLTAFVNAEKMQVFQTAGQFDKEIFFAGEERVCTEATSSIKKECSPTNRNEVPYSNSAVQNPVLSEQQVYTQVEATWHHIYNRVDGLKSINAWINREFYKGMDFTTDNQSSDEYAKGESKTEFFAKKFFAVFLPNNTTRYFALRYRYPAEGLAGMPNRLTSFEGEFTQGGWAGLWEGSIRLGKDNGVFRLSPFEYIHHEEMHSNGMAHNTGLTYGWPNHATKIFIKKYYIPENKDDADSVLFPEVEAPKYIFTTEALTQNSVKLTLYKTEDANSDNLTFEVFSRGGRSDDFIFEPIDADSVKLTFDESIFPRFFVRVYANDSDELMSKLITPTLMLEAEQTIIRDINETDASKSKQYYFIPHQQWNKLASFIDIPTDKDSVIRVCKIATQNYNANVAYDVYAQKVDSSFRNTIDSITGSKKFYGLRNYWWQYIVYDFSTNPYSWNWLRDSQNVEDAISNEDIGLMCVAPLE